MTKNKLTPFKLTIYYAVFIAVWILRNIALNNNAGQFSGWAYALISSAIKVAIWAIPCLFLIRYYETDMTITLKALFTNKVRWLKYLPVFAAFIVYVLAGEYIFTGRIGLSPKFSPEQLIGGFIFVGITEEMVFRGWLLNAMLKMMNPVWAVVINAVLFLLIHFPGWICQGTFMTSISHFGFLSIMLLSVVFSAAFIRSKNLLVPIALHMFYDLLTFVFFSI